MHEQTPQRRTSGNYPLPGTETFYHTTVKDVPRFAARQAYPWANGAPDGLKLFKIVHDNLLKHSVEIRLSSPGRSCSQTRRRTRWRKATLLQPSPTSTKVWLW
jgi:hypothetical protein